MLYISVPLEFWDWILVVILHPWYPIGLFGISLTHVPGCEKENKKLIETINRFWNHPEHLSTLLMTLLAIKQILEPSRNILNTLLMILLASQIDGEAYQYS